METRIKVRHRSPLPRPWKWEIHIDGRLKTASHESYASQAEAHAAARDVLARITSEANERHGLPGIRVRSLSGTGPI